MLEKLLLVGALFLVSAAALFLITTTACFAWYAGADDTKKRKQIK